jgi:hypothetical protein
MAFRVPTKERQVAPTALPAARRISGAGAADFGGLEAEVVGRVGRQVERVGEVAIAAEEREQILTARAAEQEETRKAKLKDRRDKLLASDAIVEFKDNLRNQRQVFSNRRGIDAFGVTNEANDHIEKLKKEMKGRMENDEIRALFDASTIMPREVFLNQTLTHEATEFNRAEDDNNNAKIETSIIEASDAVGGMNEELAIQSARLDLDTAIEQKTAKSGMTGAAAKNVKASLISSFHEGILNRKVALNAVAAKEYYNEHKKEILPDNRESIEKLLDKEDVLQSAQQATDEIFIKEDDPVERLNLARKIENPDVRKETESQVKVRNKELEQLGVEAQQEAYLDTLTKIMDVAQNEEQGLGFAKRLENPEDRIKAEKVATARFNKKIEETITDRNIQAKVYEMIDKKQITNVRQLIEFYPYLSDADYNRFITEIRNKQNPDAKIGFVKYSTAKTAYETVKSEKYDIEDSDMTKEFMFVQSQLDKHAQALGRDLTPDEANRFAAKYIVEGEAIGTGFFGGDPDLTFSEASRQGVLDVWVPFVNDDDVDGGQEQRDIAGALAAKGIITDNEEIFRLYKKEAIMNLPLSTKEVKLLNSLINQIGVTR